MTIIKTMGFFRIIIYLRGLFKKEMMWIRVSEEELC